GRPRLVATGVSTPAATQVTGTVTPAAADTGYWSVVLKNPGGLADTLLNGVYVRPPGPTLASITPSSAPNTGPVAITDLAGTGFAVPTVVQLTRSGQSSVTATSVVTVSTSHLTCVFDLTGLLPGAWDVSVRNPDGQTATLAGGFTVTGSSPVPTLSSVSPSSGYLGQTISPLTLAGTGFIPPDSVYLSGAGIRRYATAVVTQSSTQITCTLSLASLAGGGYTLTVRNYDGQTATLNSDFLITAALPPPTVVSINPTWAYHGQSVSGVLVGGTNFAAPESVFLTQGPTRVPAASVEHVSANQLRCSFNFADAATGAYDLMVKNPDGGTGVLTSAFGVEDLPQGNGPILVSVSPPSGGNDGPSTITFHGANFVSPPLVRLTRAGRFTLQPTTTNMISDSEVQGVFDLTGATPGLWDAYVRNPNGMDATLNGAFTVVQAPPAALSVTPAWGARNTTVDLVIHGQAFVGPDAVRLEHGSEQLGAVSVSTPSATEIDATVALAGASLGHYDLLVTNADGQADTLRSGFEVRQRRPVLRWLGATAAIDTAAELPLVLHGQALDDADTVYVALGAARRTAARVDHDGDSVATAHFDLRGTAPGAWTVVAANSGGDSSAAPQPLIVADPGHAGILSVTPPAGCAGATVTLTVLSDGPFAPAALWIASGADRRYGTGLVVDTTAGHWRSSAQVALAGAAAGAWDVGVQDGGGQSLSAPGGFQVERPGFTASGARARRAVARGAAAQDSLRVVNTSGCPVALGFHSSAPWLTASPDTAVLGAHGAQTVSLRLSAVGRSQGGYPATLAILAGDTSISAMSVPETLQVLEPRMRVGGTALSARLLAGSASPAGTLLGITNAGDAPLHFHAAGDVAWASVSPAAGTVDPGAGLDLTVAWSAVGLSQGIYHGNLSVTGDDSSQAPAVVALTLQVDEQPPQAPYLVSDSTAFHISLLDLNTAGRRLGLYNQGGSSTSFTARHTAPWLALSPDTGSVTPAHWFTVNVALHAGALGSGLYFDTLEVRWGTDPARWLHVPVVLNLTRSEVSPLLCPSALQAAWSGPAAVLDWSPSADLRVTRYRIYSKPEGEGWTQLGEVAVQVLHFSRAGLDTTRSWSFRVDPLDDSGLETQGCLEASLAAKPASTSSTPQVAGARAYPNPFGPHLRVRVDVPAAAGAARVKLTVFDAAGHTVAVLLDETRAPGRYVVEWDTRNGEGTAVAPGVYRVQCEINGTQVASEWVARRWAP
ncbi:MAG TPA: IPT/TIG domain-containing protein, partial [Candidatus Saccharimonadales bacterium]|nr:IPT/TIG domain-containing protein [Candidatus Saccharimonadales bacterium]